MKSGGPKTAEGKARSSLNSMKHGLLCRSLRFKSPEERAGFQWLFADVKQAIGASDRVEELIAEDIAIGYWRISEQLPFEQSEMRRRKTNVALVRDFVQEVSAQCSADLGEQVKTTLQDKLPAGECRHFTLRLSSGTAEDESDVDNSDTRKNASRTGSEMKLVFGDGLPTLLRYNSSIRRDLDRAFDRLKRWRDLKQQKP